MSDQTPSFLNEWKQWHATDCRHQKGGQIRIYAGSEGQFGPHIANVLASGPAPEQCANLIISAPDLLRQRDALLEACEAALLTMRHMDPNVDHRWESDCNKLKAAIAMAKEEPKS